jgi:hypothetical protein
MVSDLHILGASFLATIQVAWYPHRRGHLTCGRRGLDAAPRRIPVRVRRRATSNLIAVAVQNGGSARVADIERRSH